MLARGFAKGPRHYPHQSAKPNCAEARPQCRARLIVNVIKLQSSCVTKEHVTMSDHLVLLSQHNSSPNNIRELCSDQSKIYTL